MDIQTRQQIESATLRKLIDHLKTHADVQNIELMIVADFCRNCLAKWYSEAAKQSGVDIDYEAAREFVYGMPYSDWKELYQRNATQEQLEAYTAKQRNKVIE